MIAVFRFLVGFAGGAFVLTQLWTTTMFDLNCVGVANATSAGWGNLGGGVAQILNGAVFAAMKASGHNNDLSWRITLSGRLLCSSSLVSWSSSSPTTPLTAT